MPLAVRTAGRLMKDVEFRCLGMTFGVDGTSVCSLAGSRSSASQGDRTQSMKCVILAGGRGSRIGEESLVKPKPMIEIGAKPILWHIMKIYSHYGIDEFVICLGYLGYIIKEYFANYSFHQSDVTIDLSNDQIVNHGRASEPWRVTLVDTGDQTATGGRVLRVRDYLDSNEPFLLTYGDGVADVDIASAVAFHASHGRLATMTVVRPPARFGSVRIAGDRIVDFEEKPNTSEGLINGGFFVMSPKVLDLIEGDNAALEAAPLELLAAKDELRAWRHEGFWQPMDTQRDKELLQSMWEAGVAPWKVWS